MTVENSKQIHRYSNLLIVFLLLALFSATALSHGMSEAEKQSILDGGNWSYLWLGATHMLSGYDHLAFVFGIIFFLTNFRDIAKYVTAFTVGHSITLIYATFNAIQLNYFIIDAIIALSVCYIAFANIDGFRKYLNVRPPNMMIMILSLGLIHGFGLSTRLQLLPLSEDQLLMNIISFNVGVEIGQITALAGMLLLLAAWRHTHFFQRFSVIVNYSLILLGGFLFLMQMHGYEHVANAAELNASVQTVEASTKNAVQVNTREYLSNKVEWKDELTINIPARGDKEYKILVPEGKRFFYSWATGGESLFYDFHGEPSGDTTGSFQTFEKDTKTDATGELTAAFTGTHGWYWKNNTRFPVTISLKLAGTYQLKESVMEMAKPEPAIEPTKITHDSIF